MKIFLISIISLISNICFSQDVTTLNTQIQDLLTGPNLKLDKVIDSVEFYAFAIQLDIRYENGKGIVKGISVNDSIAKKLYDNLSFLKQIDFTPLVKDKGQAKVLIPVGIILAYPRKKVEGPPLVKAEQLMSKLFKMYNITYPVPQNVINEYIFLNPVICTCGIKVYD